MANEPINWKAVRAACNPKGCWFAASGTCSNEQHPKGCFTELRMFDLMRKRFFECLEDIHDGLLLAKQVPQQAAQCGLHWIGNCYACSPLSGLHAFIQKRRKKARGLLFALTSIARKHGLLAEGQDSTQTAIFDGVVEPSRAENERHPVVRVFDPNSERSFDSRKRPTDVRDNERLVIAWLKDKIAQCEAAG